MSPEGAVILADGRACRVERWSTDGMALLTVFFSVLGIENSEGEALLALLAPVVEAERVSSALQNLAAANVHRLQDAQGNEMFSLTFIVGVFDTSTDAGAQADDDKRE